MELKKNQKHFYLNSPEQKNKKVSFSCKKLFWFQENDIFSPGKFLCKKYFLDLIIFDLDIK